MSGVFKEKKTEWFWLGISAIASIVIGSLVQWIDFVGGSGTGVEGIGIGIMMSIQFSVTFAMSFQGSRGFNLAVGMGRTRKSYVMALWVATLCKYGGVAVLGLLFYMVQKYLLGIQIDSHVKMILMPELLAGVVLLLTSVDMLIGSVVLKFGEKVVYIIWGFCMCLPPFVMRIAKMVESGKENIWSKMIKFFLTDWVKYTKMQWMGIGMAVSVCITISAFYLFMRQDVRS